MSEVAQPAPHLEEHGEDPLAGDVDRFVHPDETRTDEQIEYDRKYAITPYGNDASDEYWREYDEYHGTVNGGEDPLSVVQEGEQETRTEKPPSLAGPMGGNGGNMIIYTPKGRRLQINTADFKEREETGTPLQELGRHYDKQQEETDEKVAAYRKRQKELYGPKTDEDWDEYYNTEDPLAGDVDRWVPPEETQD